MNVDTVTELKSALFRATAGTAIHTTGSTSSGHALAISGQHDVVVAGITLRTASTGLTVIDSDRFVATELLVEDIGEEGIHSKEQTALRIAPSTSCC